MKQTVDVLFTEHAGLDGKLGLITLNRPHALNALNHVMIRALDQQLRRWEEDSAILAVIICGIGRAFCAGGDMRLAYQLKQTNDPSLEDLFVDEYDLNKRIYHFSKPYIALMNGITMGGGAGVSVYGSHRVATPSMVFAMPETGIGFFPDIGASYFLSRLPYRMGQYLGLTGVTITAADCLALGLIDFIVSETALADIVSQLQTVPLGKHPDAAVAEVLRMHAMSVPPADLMNHQIEIETCFSKDKMEDILQTLERYPSAWCEATYNTLSLKSPTSLKVTLRALQLAEKHHFDTVIAMERTMMRRFIAGHDLFEGVRAQLIDKDKKPHWHPATLLDVDDNTVQAYFTDKSL